MGLTKQGKLDRLAAERGPLEHELFAAQMQVVVKEAGVKHGATGVDQDQVEAAKANETAIQAQIDALDKVKEKVDLEEDDSE